MEIQNNMCFKNGLLKNRTLFFKIRMQTPPCKFFNTQSGCKFTAEECKRPHEPFCTKQACVKINKSHTHSLAMCGRKVARPVPDNAADPPVKPIAKTIAETRTALCEKIFLKVEKTLSETTAEIAEVLDFKPSPGKIVGMFHDGLDLSDLTKMLTSEPYLVERMAEAVDVLRAAHAIRVTA